jgi:hypothetical protein
MGIEFVRKAASSYTKSIDRERVRLRTAELFRSSSPEVARTIAIDIEPGCLLHVGEELLIECEGDALIARKDIVEVGRADRPGAEITAAVAASAGIARGVVVQVNEISGVAEVRPC